MNNLGSSLFPLQLLINWNMKSIAINWIHIHFLVCIRMNPYSARKFSLPGLFNEKRWAKEKFSFIGLSELTKHSPFFTVLQMPPAAYSSHTPARFSGSSGKRVPGLLSHTGRIHPQQLHSAKAGIQEAQLCLAKEFLV